MLFPLIVGGREKPVNLQRSDIDVPMEALRLKEVQESCRLGTGGIALVPFRVETFQIFQNIIYIGSCGFCACSSNINVKGP